MVDGEAGPLPRVEGGWKTILADPPWAFKQSLKGLKVRGGAAKHYPTMAEGEMVALPVGEVVASDALLFLWSTNAHLHGALHILEAWGFRYVTMATWVKSRFGLGYWLRGRTEHLLLGVRGSPRSRMRGPHGATGLSLSTLLRGGGEEAAVLTGPVREHSRKPPAAYEMAEAMGEPPRLELFQRGPLRPGWVGWGDQAGEGVGGGEGAAAGGGEG